MQDDAPALPWLTPANVAIVVACVAAVLSAATIQYMVVLQSAPQARFFVVPAVVGTGFGVLIVAFRRAVVLKRRLADALEERQQVILDMNRDLEMRVEARTRELADKHEQLLHAQRLDLLGKLSAGVVHDLNNILAVIGACTEAASEAEDAAELGRWLSAIDDAVDRGQRLTQRLLDTSRRGQGQERLPASEVASSLVDLLGRAFGRSFELRVSVLGETGAVGVARTEQILLNLLVNARDALADGGRIEVRVGPRRLGAQEMAVLEVVDDGPGIPEEIRARIWEPFFTTKSHGDGTGQGLSTVKSLAEEVGGSVEVESGPGGTTFRVCLPTSTPNGERGAA